MSPLEFGSRAAAGRRVLATLRLAAATLLLAVAACAAHEEDGEGTAASPILTVVVDRIETDRPEWQRLARRLRRELIVALDASGSFDTVGKTAPAIAGPGLIRVDGRIEAVDPGADILATLTGDLGWGGAELRANFRLRDGDERVKAEFTESVSAGRPLAETTVIGTIFTPHFDPLYADDLADALAGEVADLIAAWAAGELKLSRTDGRAAAR